MAFFSDLHFSDFNFVYSVKLLNIILFFRLDLVHIEGKCERRVPVLITPDVKKAMDLLLEQRNACQILKDNEYFFANPANGHLDSWSVMNKNAKAAKCEKPELINGTKLRKYCATVCQVGTVMTVQEEYHAQMVQVRAFLDSFS